MLVGGRAHSAEDVAAVGEIGFDYAEISFIDPAKTKREISHLQELQEKYNLFYLAHGPEEGNAWNPHELRTQLLPRVKALLRHAAELNIPLMTIHFWLDQRFIEEAVLAEKVGLLEEMVTEAKKRGVVLAVENLSERPADFAAAFEQIPFLEMTLDIGHGELLTEENTSYAFIERYASRISHTHIHDNRGGNTPQDDLHLPLGDGVIRFRPILDALAATGYDRTITLEVKTSALQAEKQKMEQLLRAVQRPDKKRNPPR